MKYELSLHAKAQLAERNLPREWIERALFAPTLAEPDADDPALEHRLVAIGEAGDRVLRVICHRGATPLKVVTLHIDRSMKGKL